MTNKSPFSPRRIAVAIALALTAFAGASLASERIFMEIPGFTGGAIIKGFEDNLEVLTLSLGYSLPVAGQLTLTPVTITKNVDKGSATLAQAGALGKPLGTLLVRTPAPSTATGSGTAIGSNRVEYRLYNARIVDYRLVDSRGTPAAVEQITFAVSGYEMIVSPPSGTTNGPVGSVGDTTPAGGK